MIAYIESNLIGSDYELVDEYYFSEETLSLRYEKILFSGAFDQYDYVSVRINTQLIELEIFYKASSDFRLPTGDKLITEEAAITVAENLLGTGEE